jgi:hypothetical protein
MTTNKKITLGASAVMVLSVFLPYAKMGVFSISLFDAITEDPVSEPTLILLFAIGAFVSAFLDKEKIARICSGLVLAMMLYAISKLSGAQSDFSQLNVNVNLFKIIGVGAYLTLISSVLGVVFSKKQ